MKKTIVVGTGRCGTRGFAKAFGGVHEYKTFERFHPLYVRMNTAVRNPFPRFEDRLYSSKLMYHDLEQLHPHKESFMNVDNSMTWLVDGIYKFFEGDVKFILLVRDGRDFVTSAVNRGWAERVELDNYPLEGDLIRDRWDNMSLIGKASWMWNERNRRALNYLAEIPEDSWKVHRIEDSTEESLKELSVWCEQPLVDSNQILKGNENTNIGSGRYNKKIENHQRWNEKEKLDFWEYSQELQEYFGYE
jgi:hypothetical protein